MTNDIATSDTAAPRRASLRYIKHRLATSRLAPSLGRLRQMFAALEGRKHPELALLRAEDGYMEEILTDLIQPDWNCLDVGGHLGKMSYLMQSCAPRGHLSIVEALPDKAALLRTRFPKATVHAVAVSDTEGSADFFENLDAPGMSSLTNRASRGTTRKLTVPLRRLDTLLADAAPIRFLKIDVEGFEYPALQGAKALLTRDRPVILFEAGASHDGDLAGDPALPLLTWLSDTMSYDVYAVFDVQFDRPPLTPERFVSYRSYPFLAFNYLAYPRESALNPTPTDRPTC